MLEVFYHRANFGWGSDFTRRRAAKKRWVFLSVCLSVCSPRFWMSEIVRPISPWRRWSTEAIMIALDKGRFALVYAPMLNFFILLPTSDITKCRSPKNGKIWGFSPLQGDRINAFKWNLMCKRRSWVCWVCCQIWPVLVKEHLHKSP